MEDIRRKNKVIVGIVIGILLTIAITPGAVTETNYTNQTTRTLKTNYQTTMLTSKIIDFTKPFTTFKPSAVTDIYEIYEGEPLTITITYYWDPPQPTKPICLWVDEATMPAGATFPDCTCNLGEVSGVFEWTPAIGQAGEYEVIFYAGESCYDPIGFSTITIIVYPADQQPPNVNIQSPPDGSVVTTPLVTLIGLVTDDEGIVSLGSHHEWVGDEAWTSGTIDPPETYFPFEWEFELHEGWNQITIFASDANGYEGSDTIEITYGSEIPGLTFSQIDFLQGDNTILNSDWGHVTVEYTGTSSYQYFNLVVNGDWQIKNAPLWSSEGVGTDHYMGLIFDLDTTIGIDVPSLEVIPQLGGTKLSSAPSGTATTVIVMDKPVTVGGRGDEGVTYSPPEPIAVAATVSIVDSAWNFGVDNQDCGVDECVPTAFSNSLKWLDDKYDLGIPDNKKSIDGLKGPTNWNAPDTDTHGDPIPGTGGCPIDGSDWQGKETALEDYVTTTKFEMNQIDDVIAEIEKGQDIELFGPRHGATVTGIAKFSDGDYVIEVAHDTEQGENGGTEEQMLIYDSNSGQVESGIPGFRTGEGLDWFIVECPKEENNPPDKPGKPSGSTSGKTGTSYQYSSSTTDPDGDTISYWFDWGDNTNSGWTSTYTSGQTVTASNTWPADGNYAIRVKAKDEHGAESIWSDPLVVSMPKNKKVFVNTLTNFLQRLFPSLYLKQFGLL